MARSRSDTLQSPLRTSMSWKGESIDYTTYHSGSSSPQIGSRQHRSFPSAPLTAPVDFSLPRTSSYRAATTDYAMPHLSAPIAPPNDFSQAFQASMSSSSSRTPMRDTFGGGGGPLSQHAGERNDGYADDPLGMRRKRSFTGPAAATTTGAGAYGST
ncbi:hypothetical protein N0V88_001292 [Collariella sp. IMI 366227]|nr:hypothetical protein N0V88_001292 [Collariella sp. IMI 366227]